MRRCLNCGESWLDEDPDVATAEMVAWTLSKLLDYGFEGQALVREKVVARKRAVSQHRLEFSLPHSAQNIACSVRWFNVDHRVTYQYIDECRKIKKALGIPEVVLAAVSQLSKSLRPKEADVDIGCPGRKFIRMEQSYVMGEGSATRPASLMLRVEFSWDSVPTVVNLGFPRSELDALTPGKVGDYTPKGWNRYSSSYLGLPPFGGPNEMCLVSPFRRPAMSSVMPLVRNWDEGHFRPFPLEGQSIDHDSYESAVLNLFDRLCASRGLQRTGIEAGLDEEMKRRAELNGEPTVIAGEFERLFVSYLQMLKEKDQTTPEHSKLLSEVIAERFPCNDADLALEISRLAGLIGDFAQPLIAADMRLLQETK
jgi:hypothetical protein